MRLLVVGFGPFPGVARNPSGHLARALAGSARLHRVLGAKPRCLVLPTAYDAIGARLAPALSERPDAVLLFGVAKRARRVRVEACARNRVSLLAPDASGRAATRFLLDAEGPAERRAARAGRAVRIVKAGGVDAALSRDAGRYLCNAAYYAALAADLPALFIHIPLPPGFGRPQHEARAQRTLSTDRWLHAFTAVAIDLAASGRGTSRPSRP